MLSMPQDELVRISLQIIYVALVNFFVVNIHLNIAIVLFHAWEGELRFFRLEDIFQLTMKKTEYYRDFFDHLKIQKLDIKFICF